MDIITIFDNDNNQVNMEVVLTYKFNMINYIIYRSLDKCDYFIAKYLDDGSLDTELNDEEIEYGQEVLRGVLDEVKG